MIFANVCQCCEHVRRQGIKSLFLILLSFGVLSACSDSDQSEQQVGQESSSQRGRVLRFPHEQTHPKQRVALVIGNGAYLDEPLPNPPNDSDDMATVLKQVGFEVVVLKNASLEKMETAIQVFGEKLKKGGIGLFYFAGHGVQYQGENYLFPIGAMRSVTAAGHLRHRTMNVGYLLATMEEAKNNLNIVILDACRNNPFARSLFIGRGVKNPDGLALMDVPTGTLIAYATRPNKTALDGTVGGRNSPYVKYLKQELPKPGLSILKVLTNVRVAVKKETNNLQAPGFYSELDREFCFVEPCGQPVSPPTPVLNSQEQIAATLADLEKPKAALKLQEEKLKQQANAEKISRLLLKCKAHFEANRLTIGIGGTALACYRQVLEFEPGNEKALEGLEEIENRYVAWIEGATRRNQQVEVNRYLASLRLVNPDSPHLAQFEGGKVFRDSLKDGSLGPEMVWIAAGSFKMGDIQGGGDSDEKPVHDVSVGRFAMGRYEVTFAEYDKFADATGRKKPGDNGWGRGNRPVIDVSWYDATAYAEWLSTQTGKQYRLPTEAEWEYAARAGTETKYWWGNWASHKYANYGTDSCCDGLAKGKDRWKYTAPVGFFDANQFGLHDTVGNVWEWTCSKYKSKYNGEEKRCTSKTNGSHRVLRGGSWNINPGNVRVANRDTVSGDYRNVDVGFRLTRLLITL